MQFHTYKLMTNATPLCHGALVLRMAGMCPGVQSDALVACTQPGPRSGVGIPGFLLPVAEGVLEGAVPVPGIIPARERTLVVVVAGVCSTP